MPQRSRLWLLLPPLWLCAVDAALTLAGQPAEYWAGDYSRVVESNPLARWLLAAHPLQFVGAGALWVAVVVAVVWRAPARVAAWSALVVAVGHASGGSSWLVGTGPLGGWLAAVAYLVLSAWLAGLCWERAGRGEGAVI